MQISVGIVKKINNLVLLVLNNLFQFISPQDKHLFHFSICATFGTSTQNLDYIRMQMQTCARKIYHMELRFWNKSSCNIDLAIRLLHGLWLNMTKNWNQTVWNTSCFVKKHKNNVSEIRWIWFFKVLIVQTAVK